MAADIIAFHDPNACLTGEPREAALQLYRDACGAIVARAISRAFTEAARTPGCQDLSVNDAAAVFQELARLELDRSRL